jgi:hypothetical protein
MSYTALSLSLLNRNIEGGWNEWLLLTTDSIDKVVASAYVSDGGKLGAKVGDIVWVVNQTAGVNLSATKCQVSAVQSTTAGSLTFPTSCTLQQADASVISLTANPRNLIDAGDATTNPFQLGTGQQAGSSSAKMLTDRFAGIGGTSSSWNFQRSANTDIQGFSQAFQWGRSSTDTHTTGLTFGQVFETVDAIRAQGLPVTLSHWAKAGASFAAGASAGVARVQLLAGTGTDDTFANAAAGSWTGATTVVDATFTPTTVSTRFGPFSGVVPTNATQLAWLLSYQPSAGTTAGTTEFVQLMGIQAELGGMTPFEHLDVAEVLNVCTRYLQVINEPTAGVAVGPAAFSASSIAQVHVPLAAPMRKAPTVTFTAGGFAITDSALGAHTVSSGAFATNTPVALTGTLTCAVTLTAGLVSFLQGRTTGSGIIIADADYA